MNLLLILREEIVCLIILIYLAFISRTYRMGKDGRLFNLILSFAIAHVVLDGITVWTVNHTDTVSPALNDLFHILFFVSAVLYGTAFFRYVLDLSLPGLAVKWHKALMIPAGLYVILLPTVLKIQYKKYDGTWASAGSAPVAGFLICYLFFIISIVLILAKRKQVARHIQLMLLPMLFLLIATECIQLAVKEFLFTGGAVTVITVAFFFSLENPAAVLERKVMMDAMSGLGSRSSYERDMAAFEKEFGQDKSSPFTFMFIDINNLRSINGLYGHQEGDSYISDVAVLLMNNLKGADRIYRMGGDEFLAVYRKDGEQVIDQDIQRVHAACRKESEKKKYTPELAIGYAISDEQYNSLRDVLRVADYMMYRNKADLKHEAAIGVLRERGTRLNLSGLTDRVFDAMCLTGDRYYPYIMNMETGVTRVAPAMVEFFKLEDEFISDFEETWNARIHPDDLEAYRRDLRETIRGDREYHYCRYRVKDADGNYVEVTCRGGVYHGRDGEPDIFCGYLVNHGAPETVDSATGLRNYSVLNDRLTESIRSGAEAILLKLDFTNNYRIRMLYGSAAIGIAMRSMADITRKALRGRGEAFSRDGGFFMCYLPGYSREDANQVYQEIRARAAEGIQVGGATVPVNVTAGAVELPDGTLRDAESIRGAAMFAAEEAWNTPGDAVTFFKAGETAVDEEEIGLLKIVHRDCINDRSRFFLRFQPIIRSETGRVAGAEALLRWNSDEFGEVTPGRFISFLENDPAYTVLGYDIIRSAVREAKKIRETLPDFNINVNITAMQLYAENFIDQVGEILRKEDYPAEHLILELTERCKEMEFDVLKQRVAELRKTGIRVALDDMGTGFSTLDLLLHLPVDEIKLDMAFTAELESNANNEMFARVLCKIARNNNMFICFEGVETEHMRNYLNSYGSMLQQGYYFDRPMLAEDFERKYCRE